MRAPRLNSCSVSDMLIDRSPAFGFSSSSTEQCLWSPGYPSHAFPTLNPLPSPSSRLLQPSLPHPTGSPPPWLLFLLPHLFLKGWPPFPPSPDYFCFVPASPSFTLPSFPTCLFPFLIYPVLATTQWPALLSPFFPDSQETALEGSRGSRQLSPTPASPRRGTRHRKRHLTFPWDSCRTWGAEPSPLCPSLSPPCKEQRL